MIKKGIKWRLTITYLLITLVIMSTVYFSLTQGLEHYLIRTVENRMITHARVFTHYAELTFLGNDLAQRFGEDVQARVRILDYRGIVVGDSDFPTTQMGQRIDSPIVKKAMAGEIDRVVVRRDGEGRIMNIAAPLITDNSIIGVVHLSTSLDEVDDTLQFFRLIFMITTLLSLVVAFGIGSYLAKTVTEPLREVTVAANELSKGDFDYYIEKRHDDEVGVLADTFNLLSQQLKETIGEISGERNKLSAVLVSIVDSVIAVDRGGQFLLVNPAAEQMFHVSLEQLSGARYQETEALSPVREIFDATLREGAITIKELLLDNDGEGRTVRVHMAPIRGKGNVVFGAVGVFRDMSELKHLENRRVEFLSNVSHELRTPLTTIKGFAITLQDELEGQDPSLNRYVEIIDREADRLSRLVSDLMDVSLIESGKIKLNYQSVDLLKLLHQAVQQFAHRAKEKNIRLETDFPVTADWLMGDEDRLIQVFINLIDNGIKYTTEGGLVHLTLKEEKNTLMVQVADTGFGIPEEDLPHLFERFYRVEKARSRKHGGTGLGLSIVHAIVAAHQGTIEVESRLNQGTTFKIILPKRPKLETVK